MRTSRTITLAVLAASGLLLAGCNKAIVSTTAANTSTGAAKASSGAAAATVGSTIDLTDNSGDKLAVTIVKVDPKATATDGFSSPPAGDSFFAVQVQIKNLGPGAYSDSPSNGMTVKDAKGQGFQFDIVQGISSGTLMPATVNLAVGDTALGWEVFDVTTGDTVTQVEFTTDSGMGSSSGEWTVG